MTETPSKLLSVCCAPLQARPPSLAQTRSWHCGADRFLTVTRPLIVPGVIGLGVGAAAIANALPSRYAMLPAAVFYAVAGGWCSLNFVRCREAHCLVTGVGFDALALAALAAAVLDRHWYNLLSLLIVPVLVGGVLFEATWTIRRGGNAVRGDIGEQA